MMTPNLVERMLSCAEDLVKGGNLANGAMLLIEGAQAITDRTMKSPEGYEKDDICKYLDKRGAWYFRPYMAGFGKAGVGDIIACIAGTFWSVEVKREGKEPTVLQWTRIDEIRAAGGQATWGTAEKVISEIEAWRSTMTKNATS
jgi:hypothetical protein